MLPLFEYIMLSSSVFLGEINVIVIVDWSFHVSDFLRLFISFENGLVLLRYSLIDRFLFISPLLSYSI